jgi:DNA-binding ferritin-like protein
MAQNHQWVYYNIYYMKSIEELSNLYVAFLRAIYITHQNSHWLCKGKTFYGDHLMLERAYKSAGDDTDAIAEKVIGVFGEEALDPILQSQFISKILEKNGTDNPVATSLDIEKRFLAFSKKYYDTIKNEGKMTQGLDNLILQVADNREVIVYLLGQASKTEGSKFAARKILLNRFAKSK